MDSRLHFIFLVIIDVLAVVSTVFQVGSASIIAIMLTGLLILVGTPIQSFYTMLGTCLLAGTFLIGNIRVYFILMLITYIKIDRKIFLTDKFAFWVFLLIILYVIHDVRYATPGVIATYCCYLLYVFKMLSIVNWDEYNHRYAIIIFLVSILINQIGAAFLTGDLSMLADESSIDMRLGEGDVENGMNNNLGGAMDFPIHTLLFMTLSLPIIMGSWATTVSKIIISILFIGLFIVTFFTTSRVYLLGLSAFAVLIMIMMQSTEYGFGSKVISVVLILFALYFFFSSGYVNLFQTRFAQRNMEDYGMTSSRALIASDCISYLVDHPLAIIFGEGYIGYSTIGEQSHLLFQMTAHNIVLDCIMAFGMYGFLLICLASKNFYENIKSDYDLSGVKVLGLMPLICWFVMCLTNSACMNAKTYVLIPFLILHIFYCHQLLKY